MKSYYYIICACYCVVFMAHKVCQACFKWIQWKLSCCRQNQCHKRFVYITGVFEPCQKLHFNVATVFVRPFKQFLWSFSGSFGSGRSRYVSVLFRLRRYGIHKEKRIGLYPYLPEKPFCQNIAPFWYSGFVICDTWSVSGHFKRLQRFARVAVLYRLGIRRQQQLVYFCRADSISHHLYFI